MPGELNVLVAFALFAGACAILIGGGLVVISLTLRARASHRRRVARVGRRRMAGHIDIDETRLHLLRRHQEGGVLVSLSDTLARFVPVLDSARVMASLRRSGLKLSFRTFVALTIAASALIALVAVFGAGISPFLAALPSLLGGMYVLDLAVRLRGDMMADRFMKQLPNALDAMVRGVRAGLPVLECIAIVGNDFDDPLGGYFRGISERVQLGETLDVSLWRAAEVIDRAEMDFLAICISIQLETGGSLSEALGNLSALLRAREAMKLKIKAISSEAKASACIVGALPFAMLGILLVVNPSYVAPLFTDPRGQAMLMFGLGSITIGAIVMWRMTKFEI